MSDETPLGSALPAGLASKRHGMLMRPLLPEIDAAAKNGVGHEAIIEWLGQKGIVISLAALRKALYAYRRQNDLGVRGREGGSGEQVLPARPPSTPVRDEAQLAAPNTDRLEQPVNETPTPPPTSVQPMSVLADVLDPKRRASIADEFMNFHEQPRLGRKKAEQ